MDSEVRGGVVARWKVLPDLRLESGGVVAALSSPVRIDVSISRGQRIVEKSYRSLRMGVKT